MSKGNPSVFERETTIRLLTEAARHWLISKCLAAKKLPEPGKFWVYPENIDWGNALEGKRIEIEIRVVDYPPAELAKEQTNV